jgi:hypothetical protein
MIINVGNDRLPEVRHDGKIFTIIGKCYPEYGKTFFDIIGYYLKSNIRYISVVNIEVEYFSTSAYKYIFDIFRNYINDTDIIVNWYYYNSIFDGCDEDMVEQGECIMRLLNINIILK